MRSVLSFDLRFKPAATYLYLRYSDSYTNYKFWHIITYEDAFMKVNNYIALKSEQPIKHGLKLL